MSKTTTTILVLAAIVVLAGVCGFAVMNDQSSDEPDAPVDPGTPDVPDNPDTPDVPDNPDVPDKTGTTAKVWFDDGVNDPVMNEATAGDIRGLLDKGIPGHSIEYKSNGMIKSVDGRENDSGHAWVVFRWASPAGWDVFDEKKTEFVDGMNVALRYAEKTAAGSTVTYSAPDIDVEYEVYFFLQFREQLNATEWMAGLPLSDEEKQEGVWISGTGSTNNEALADAVLKTFFPGSEYKVIEGQEGGKGKIEYIVDGKTGMFTYGTSLDMYGWFVSFLGWSDKKVGEGGDYGAWTFWTQFNYSPDAKTLDDSLYWEFDQLSFGLYDITKYRYFGLVLKTSTMEDSSIDLSTPSEIPAGL